MTDRQVAAALRGGLVLLALLVPACAVPVGSTGSADQVSAEPPAVPSSSSPSPGNTRPSAPAVGSSPLPEPTAVLAALEALPVKGRAPRAGYDRDLFGSGWVDVDRNGCDTRNDVLRRDLTGETLQPGTGGCVVLTGTLADPYSGRTIDFRRGQDSSDDVQIDHVVALSDAWQKGAQRWDAARRTRFANDPRNLLAVDGTLNLQKGDGDAATWLPPNRGYRCAYVARQVAVKASYGLWMTQAEKDAIGRILGGCPDEPLPADGAAPASVPAPSPASPPAVFANCTAARQAGAAPVHRGDPGYGSHLDGDGDGVGCD